MNVFEGRQPEVNTPNKTKIAKRKYKKSKPYRSKIKSPKIVPRGWSFSSSDSGNQTQSHGMQGQVRVFECYEPESTVKPKVKIPKQSIKKEQNKLTSWEIYNYILRGLVGELQELGADDEFKQVAYHLWLTYLTKLECIPQESNAASKLTVRNREKQKSKRKCRSNTSKTPVHDKSLSGIFNHPDQPGPSGFPGPADTKGEKGESAYSEVYHKHQRGEPGLNESNSAYGLPGPRGPSGSKGQKSNMEKRTKRSLGSIREEDDKVDRGENGQKGESDIIRDSCSSGPSGEKGLPGDPGPRGRDGYSEAPGPSGQKADRGIEGLEGSRGRLGSKSPNGPRGGRKGRPTPPGPLGPRDLDGFPVELNPRTVSIMKMIEKTEQDTRSNSFQSETESLTNVTSDDEYPLSNHNETTSHQLFENTASEIRDLALDVFTRHKLYCILYLAMLLTQQDLQIGDVIRYCREGNLSFLDYDHFFPDNLYDTIDHSVYSGGNKSFPSFQFLQSFTFKLYEFLEIRPCDFSPNILKLCRRFCTELNLPDQFYNIAGDFINKTRPFESKTKPTCIANYEGRAMAFIIYVFRVLLGFDDVTEYELSKFAQLVNNKNREKSLFNFSEWSTYIEYRKIVLKRVHFPTWQLLHPDKDCPLDLYVKYIYSKKDAYEKKSSDTAMNAAKQILADVELLQDDPNNSLIIFHPSVTPNRSYLEQLKDIENFKVLDQSLNINLIKDASKQSIEYLVEHEPYLNLINAKKCSIILGNAHPNYKLKKIELNLEANNPSLFDQDETDPEIEGHLENIKDKKGNKGMEYKYHYIPRMEYCSNICDMANMTTEKFKEYEATLPKSFQWLIKECARMIEQDTKDLFTEVVNVEIYMNYIYLKNKPQHNIPSINKIIERVKENW